MPQTWIDSTLVKTTFDVWNFQIWQAWKTKESVEKQGLYCLLSLSNGKISGLFLTNELCFLLFVQSLKSKLSEANNGSLNLI